MTAGIYDAQSALSTLRRPIHTAGLQCVSIAQERCLKFVLGLGGSVNRRRTASDDINNFDCNSAHPSHPSSSLRPTARPHTPLSVFPNEKGQTTLQPLRCDESVDRERRNKKKGIKEKLQWRSYPDLEREKK